MKNVMQFRLKKGVSGFRVDAVNHLFEKSDLQDEPVSGYTNDPYNYAYTHHIYTKDLDEMYDMVYQWRELVDKWQKDNGGETRILMTEAYTSPKEYPRYFRSRSDPKRMGAQMPFNFWALSNLDKYSNAQHFLQIINESINSVPKDTRLNWVMGNHDQPRYSSRFGIEKIEIVMTLVMTLPGIAITYYVSVYCSKSSAILSIVIICCRTG